MIRKIYEHYMMGKEYNYYFIHFTKWSVYGFTISSATYRYTVLAKEPAHCHLVYVMSWCGNLLAFMIDFGILPEKI